MSTTPISSSPAPSLRDSVTIAVSENNDANNRMTELFHTKGYVESAVIEMLGRLFYHDLHDTSGIPARAPETSELLAERT